MDLPSENEHLFNQPTREFNSDVNQDLGSRFDDRDFAGIESDNEPSPYQHIQPVSPTNSELSDQCSEVDETFGLVQYPEFRPFIYDYGDYPINDLHSSMRSQNYESGDDAIYGSDENTYETYVLSTDTTSPKAQTARKQSRKPRAVKPVARKIIKDNTPRIDNVVCIETPYKKMCRLGEEIFNLIQSRCCLKVASTSKLKKSVRFADSSFPKLGARPIKLRKQQQLDPELKEIAELYRPIDKKRSMAKALPIPDKLPDFFSQKCNLRQQQCSKATSPNAVDGNAEYPHSQKQCTPDESSQRMSQSQTNSDTGIARSKRDPRKDILKLMIVGDETMFTIDKSDMGGNGLITLIGFKQNDYVLEYTGEVLKPDEGRLRELKYQQEEPLPEDYWLRFTTNEGNEWMVDGRKGRSSRLINHSREKANLKLRYFIPKPKDGSEPKPRFYFVATKDILPGEELFYIYPESRPAVLNKNPWLKR